MFGRYGGFADRVRCDWLWAVPLPASLTSAEAAPLFCGGITVFNPLVQMGVLPTDRAPHLGEHTDEVLGGLT